MERLAFTSSDPDRIAISNGIVVCSEGDRRNSTIVVRCASRYIKSTTFHQTVA